MEKLDDVVNDKNEDDTKNYGQPDLSPLETDTSSSFNHKKDSREPDSPEIPMLPSLHSQGLFHLSSQEKEHSTVTPGFDVSLEQNSANLPSFSLRTVVEEMPISVKAERFEEGLPSVGASSDGSAEDLLPLMPEIDPDVLAILQRGDFATVVKAVYDREEALTSYMNEIGNYLSGMCALIGSADFRGLV